MHTFIRSIQLARTAPVLCATVNNEIAISLELMSARARAQKQQTNGTKETHRGSPMVRNGRGFRWIQMETACARSHEHINSYCFATRDRRPMLHCGKSQQFELEKAEVIARRNAQNEQSERAKKERWPSTWTLLLLLIINTPAMQFRYFYVKIIN